MLISKAACLQYLLEIDTSSAKNDHPSFVFSDVTKHWLLGNAIISIRKGKLGWNEVLFHVASMFAC